MANVDSPFGLRLVKGGKGPVIRCYAPSTYATALYVGDTVVWTGEADATGEAPEVNLSGISAASRILGVIEGFEVNPANLNITYGAASTARYMKVRLANPDDIYEIQASGTTVLTTTSVGLNALLIRTHSGSTTTGLSGAELDSGDTTGPSSGATLQLTIIGVSSKPDNDITACNAKFLVTINLPSIAADTAGV